MQFKTRSRLFVGFGMVFKSRSRFWVEIEMASPIHLAHSWFEVPEVVLDTIQRLTGAGQASHQPGS